VLRVYGGIENLLDCGAGDDRITGGSGADRILGGAGADRLRGGAGEDAFVFLWAAGATAATRDTILDFGVGTAARGDDVIDVSAIDANASVAGDQTFAFGGTTQNGVGFLWVEDSTTGSGSLVMGNTGGAQPLVIAVEDGASRAAADWLAGDFVL
jgi:Ca2+-binding RTX toxin-like protein